MAEVVLSTDDLTVLGGPTSINIEVDLGAQGDRGTLIFSVDGNPNLSSTSGLPDTLQLYDMAINIAPSSSEYLALYQYTSTYGTDNWTELTRISPNAISINYPANFTTGVAQFLIPLNGISGVAALTPANFNIQYSIEHDVPLASCIAIAPTFTVDSGINYLVFTITATEIDGTLLSGVKTVQLFFTVV